MTNMKKNALLSLTLVTIAILLCAVLVSGCAGTRARDNTLVPAMRLSWTGLRADAEYSGPGEATVAAMDLLEQALDSGDRSALRRVDWAPIEAAALAGIDAKVADGVVSEGVAAVLRRRVRTFAEALVVAQQRSYKIVEPEGLVYPVCVHGRLAW